MDFSEAVPRIMEFVVNNCLVNSKITQQAEVIKKIKPGNMVLLVPFSAKSEMVRFFEHLLLYCIFESIMRLEIDNDIERKVWLEKIWLQIVTIQYWLCLLCEVKGSVTQEECSIAVYSIMRVLNHSEGILEKYYDIWHRIGEVPEILW